MAVFLGSLIGYERRSSDRPAGIRTMALVSLGSALFTINSTFGFLSGPMVSAGGIVLISFFILVLVRFGFNSESSCLIYLILG